MGNSKNRVVLGILFLVFLFFILLMAFGIFTIKALKKTQGQAGLWGKDLGIEDQIAVISVDGVIMKARPIIEKLLKAERNKNVKAIIIRINSPGGAVGPTQEIYDEIRRIDLNYTEKRKNGKPVYASLGTVAASGGYYIAAAARKIYANPGTLTGSIGVIMQFVDLSKLYQMAKVSPNTIKAGKYKDVGHPTRPMTQEEEELLQGMMDGVHDQFIDHIVRVRKKKLKKEIDELAQGQIFSGEQAKKFGLVDELGGLWACGRDIHTELKLDGEMTLKFIEKKKNDFFDLLQGMDSVVGKMKTLIPSTEGPTPAFLYK